MTVEEIKALIAEMRSKNEKLSVSTTMRPAARKQHGAAAAALGAVLMEIAYREQVERDQAERES